MCLTIAQIGQACGFLLLNEFSVFTYCCKRCASEFGLGVDLESHILSEHSDDNKHVENIFVNDGVLESPLIVTIKAEPVALDDCEQFKDNGEPTTERVEQNIEYFRAEEEENLEKKCSFSQRSTIFEQNCVTFEPKTLTFNQKYMKNQQKKENFLENDDPNVRKSMEKATKTTEEMANSPLTENKSQSMNLVIDNRSSNSRNPNDSDSDELTEVKWPNEKSSPEKRKRRKRNDDSTSELFYCDMCPSNKVSFSCKENVRQHMRRHIKNKVRKQCSICLKTPLNYDKHMQFTHMDGNPYKCDYCGAAFKNNSNRVIHMRTHTGAKPFQCDRCGKSFKSQDTRAKHNMRVHAKRLPHECQECNRSFISPSQLQEHCYAFHSDERPYKCEICLNSYSTRKYLRKHKFSHGEKTHACKYCEKKFKTTETRRWHERTVHKAV